ncbi:MAG: hypothetical protein IMY72_01920 [Bacteroidetes bacterium]|nr:hypothetical protein [Bacteroidota bacterium]
MKLSENALSEFKKMIDEGKQASSGIRFFTTQGCCSPMLQLEISQNPTTDDIVVKKGDVDFFITPEAEKILSEISIDFVDGSFKTEKLNNDTNNESCCGHCK